MAKKAFAVIALAIFSVFAVPVAANAADLDATSALASAPYQSPVLLIWGAAGALIFITALCVVMTIARRESASA